MFDVLALGAANTDFFFYVKKFPSVDDEVDAFSIDKNLGGSAANFATGCSKLGLKTRFLGCIGSDSEGNQLVEEFASLGVDTSLIKRVDVRTGRVIILIDEQRNRKMAAFIGANNLLSSEMLTAEVVGSARLVHITSLSSENAFEAFVKAKKLAFDSNVLVSVDPGHILAERSFDELKVLLEGIDFCFPSRKGLEKMTGKVNVEEGCKVLSNLVKNVIVTLGKKGCFVYSNGRGFIVSPVKATVLDTTGAGDAFASAFVYGVLEGKSLKECAEIANLAAGLSVGGKGARSAQVSEPVLLKELKKLE